MHNILLNCDLGEWESREHTEKLMQEINLANIACGGHAGDLQSIYECLDLCHQYQVKAGAHPGLTEAAGRSCAELNLDTFNELLIFQLSTFNTACEKKKIPLHHIKLHGSLYHLTENNSCLRERYLQIVKNDYPQAKIICLAKGKVAEAAKQWGIGTLHEVFLDRSYLPSGLLVPRSEKNAVLHSEKDISLRLSNLSDGYILDHTNHKIQLPCDTLCIHSDTKNSLTNVRLAKTTLALERG